VAIIVEGAIVREDIVAEIIKVREVFHDQDVKGKKVVTGNEGRVRDQKRVVVIAPEGAMMTNRDKEVIGQEEFVMIARAMERAVIDPEESKVILIVAMLNPMRILQIVFPVANKIILKKEDLEDLEKMSMNS